MNSNAAAMTGYTHSCGVDGTDLETGRVQRARLLLEFICGRKRMVAQIHVVLESERDLAMGEQPTGRVLVVQPLEDRFEGVKPTIEREHNLRSWFLCLFKGHGNVVLILDSSGCRMSGTMMKGLLGGEEEKDTRNYNGRDPSRVTDPRL